MMGWDVLWVMWMVEETLRPGRYFVVEEMKYALADKDGRVVFDFSERQRYSSKETKVKKRKGRRG
jgi:hypothetical protein